MQTFVSKKLIKSTRAQRVPICGIARSSGSYAQVWALGPLAKNCSQGTLLELLGPTHSVLHFPLHIMTLASIIFLAFK